MPKQSRREELKDAGSPQRADWCLNIIVDRDTGYLADGDDYLYLTGPEDMAYEDWAEYARKYAGDDQLVEWTATPLSQGRWWKTGRKNSFTTKARGY